MSDELNFVECVEENKFTVLDDDLYPWALGKMKVENGFSADDTDTPYDIAMVPKDSTLAWSKDAREYRVYLLSEARKYFYKELAKTHNNESQYVKITTIDRKWRD